MAYQVILEPGLGTGRSVSRARSPPSAYSYEFAGTFSCAQYDPRKTRERELATLDEQLSSGIAEPYSMRLCRVWCANSKRFGTKSSCRNTHSVTSLYHAGARNMEQAVPRYYVCFTVTAAALAGSTYQASNGASKRTQK